MKKIKYMKKITLTESELINIIKKHVNEDFNMGSPNSSDTTGAVEIDKTTNPNPADLKKYTSQGIDVKLMDENVVDEEMGEEQPLKLKHKFENEKNGIKLNIYSTKDKVKLSEIFDYLISLKEQLDLQKAFNLNSVHLYLKKPSSGRYEYGGTLSSETFHKYVNMLKDNKSQKEPNKKIIKI